MAYRIKAQDITKILDFNTSINDLNPFIAAAEELVTELCVPAGYSAGRLAIIETWLAAHFVAIRDPRYVSESLGGESFSVAIQTGLNLGLTPYGQQAMLLDTNGSLARIDKHVAQGKRATVQITWLGSSPDRYLDRPWLFTNLLING